MKEKLTKPFKLLLAWAIDQKLNWNTDKTGILLVFFLVLCIMIMTGLILQEREYGRSLGGAKLDCLEQGYPETQEADDNFFCVKIENNTEVVVPLENIREKGE